MIRKKLDDIAGKICETVLPIRQEYYLGRGTKYAICTLGSVDLLENISRSKVMDRIAIAGRLFSENKGIDAIIKFTLEHPGLEQIIVCGKDVKGHRPGQALLALYKSGIDPDGRIIGAAGQYPVLQSLPKEVDAFRKQIRVSDLIGTVDAAKIISLVS